MRGTDVESGTETKHVRWRTLFEVSTTVIMVALASALVWQGREGFFASAPAGGRSVTPVPWEPLTIAGKPILGASSARVAIVEYSDFACPFCGAVARDTLPTVIREYVDPGKVILVFKNFPLPSHPSAPHAAAAALCAGQQGKFWQMHDRMFDKPMKLTEQELRETASQLGLDLTVYDSCRAEPTAAQLVEADRSEAETLKITGTPTFFFGTVEPDGRIRVTDVLSGAKPVANFKAILDRLLK
jgi:protein-disulfide isomerase